VSDAVTCDGPDCKSHGHAPFLGWIHVTITGGSRRMDFCSWACLGAFVMDACGTVNEFEQALSDMRSEEKPASDQ